MAAGGQSSSFFAGSAAAQGSAADAILSRIRAVEDQRSEVLQRLQAIRTTLDHRFKRRPNRPRGDAAHYDQLIDQLEARIRNERLSLAAEKQVMREIRDLKREKRTITEFHESQEEIAQLKQERTDLHARMDGVMALLKELRQGLDRARLLDKVNALNPDVDIPLTAIHTEELRIAQLGVARLVGPQGTTIARVQQETGVVVDINRSRPERKAGGKGARGPPETEVNEDGTVTVLLSGVEGALAVARARVEELADAVEATVDLPRGFRLLLIADSAAEVQALESELDCRLTLQRREDLRDSDQTVTVTVLGSRPGVARARARLERLAGTKVELPCATLSLPSVIGSRGSNLQKLQKDHKCSVDIERGDADGKMSKLVVCALRPAALAAAAADAEELIRRETQFSEYRPCDDDFVGYLLADKAKRINDVQRAHNVRVQVRRLGQEGAEEEGEAVARAARKGAYVLVRGRRADLAAGVAALTELTLAFERTHAFLLVPVAAARSLISQGGSDIAKLREAAGGCTIDVDMPAQDGDGEAGGRGRRHRSRPALPEGRARVVVVGETPEQLAAGRALVEEAIGGYRERPVEMAAHQALALIGRGGSNIKKLQEESGAYVQVPSLPQRQRTEAEEAEEEEAAGGRRSGGRGRGRRSRRGGSKIDEDAIVTVRISGQEQQVADAVAAVEAIVAANQVATEALPTRDVLVSLIGDGGSNVKDIRAKTGITSLDVDDRACSVRVVGTAEAVVAAQQRIRDDVAAYMRTNRVVPIQPALLSNLIGRGGANIRQLQEDTGCRLRTIGEEAVRVTAEDPEALQRGVDAVREAAGFDKHLEEVSFDARDDDVFRSLRKAMRAAEAGGDVECRLSRGRGVVVVLGEPAAVAPAASMLRRAVIVRPTVLEKVAFPVARSRALFGPGGATIRLLQAQTGVDIDFPPPKARPAAGDATVRLRGPTAAVHAAKLVLAAIAADEAYFCLPLPADVADLVERAGSDALAAAARGDSQVRFGSGTRALAGAKPALAKSPARRAGAAGAAGGADDDDLAEPERLMELLVITGPSQRDVADTVTAVQDVIEFAVGSALMTFPVPPAAVDALRGIRAQRKGSGGARARRRKAAKRDGASAAAAAPAAAEAEAAPSLQDVVEGFEGRMGGWVDHFHGRAALCGLSAEVRQARIAIERACKAILDVQAAVAVPTWALPALIGQGGSKLRALEAEAGCGIQIPRAAGESGDLVNVTVSGTDPAKTRAGLAVVQARVAELTGRVEVIEIDPSAVPALIGRGGATIRQLQEDSGCRIDIDKADNTVTVRGDSSAAKERGAAAVRAVLAEQASAAAARQPDASRLLTTSQEGALAVIGRGGATIRGLEQESGARIDVDKAMGEVRISGSGPAVQTAVLGVQAILAELDAVAAPAEEAPAATAAAAAPVPMARSYENGTARSKRSLRRERKRLQQEEGDEEGTDEEEEPAPATPPKRHPHAVFATPEPVALPSGSRVGLTNSQLRAISATIDASMSDLDAGGAAAAPPAAAPHQARPAAPAPAASEPSFMAGVDAALADLLGSTLSSAPAPAASVPNGAQRGGRAATHATAGGVSIRL